jgi:hypothetical protein
MILLGCGRCQSELASVVVVVLGGVVVDIAKGHAVVEVRVPADREVHSSVQTVLER